jgi:peptidoglycan hydrolase-like protein with peptidoglycan-binding domain
MEILMQKILTMLIAAAVWVAFSAGSAWTQTTPDASQTQKEGAGERTGEEKMKARGTQEPGQTERKKGEEEMEARGAQKAGRMGKSGAAETEGQDGQRWSKQDLKKAQEALINKGHNPGSIDGIMGPQTRAAIKAFQSANGLKGTGRLDEETASKLAVSSK